MTVSCACWLCMSNAFLPVLKLQKQNFQRDGWLSNYCLSQGQTLLATQNKASLSSTDQIYCSCFILSSLLAAPGSRSNHFFLHSLIQLVNQQGVYRDNISTVHSLWASSKRTVTCNHCHLPPAEVLDHFAHKYIDCNTITQMRQLQYRCWIFLESYFSQANLSASQFHSFCIELSFP